MREAAMLARRLRDAERGGRPIAKLTDEFPAMTLADAYAVQDELRRLVLADGEHLAGFKAGLTSRAKMVQMGVDVPTVGFLTRERGRRDGASIAVAGSIHPRVEPEVAFFLKRPLRGPCCDAERVLDATDFVVAAIEVLDSRYENFRFDLPSVVADDNSASYYVVGEDRRDPRALDLAALAVALEKNGEVAARGAASAVLDHPANAVAMVANHLGERGEEIAAGSVILSGGITEAIAVQAGDRVTARLGELGQITTRFV
jgi:2-oxo-3-hexenedioate decarboxylase